MDNGDGWETFRAVDEKNALVLGDLLLFGYGGVALFGSVWENFRAGVVVGFLVLKAGWLAGERGPAPGVRAWNPHQFDLNPHESELQSLPPGAAPRLDTSPAFGWCGAN
jgi:hypothetical protein